MRAHAASWLLLPWMFFPGALNALVLLLREGKKMSHRASGRAKATNDVMIKLNHSRVVFPFVSSVSKPANARHYHGAATMSSRQPKLAQDCKRATIAAAATGAARCDSITLLDRKLNFKLNWKHLRM